MLGFILFTLAINFICICSANDLPLYFPKCNIDDPDLNRCILKASEEVREYVKKGVPELDIPSLDPLFVPEIKTQQGTNAVNYKITLTNATIRGLGDYVFEDFTYNPKTLVFHGSSTFKSMSLVSNYEIDGKILVAPVNGKGVLNVELGPSTGTLDVQGELFKRNGEEYYNPVNIKSTIVVGKITGSIDGLFSGNEELARATNQLIKEHSDEIVKEVKPAIEKVADELIRKMILGINKNLPYKKLFPPSH